MKKILNILFITLFFLFTFSSVKSFAQDASAKDNAAKNKGGRSDAFANNTTPDDIRKKSKNDANKKGPAKQIKSARPDMSKSRGARPPDIVRPSGSRIPKGVGRPAGSAMHGR